jgi:competence protein ComEC
MHDAFLAQSGMDGGLATSASLGLTPIQWGLACGLIFASLILFRKHKLQRALFVIFFTFALGAWRAQSAQPSIDENHVSRFNGFTRPVKMTGVVIAPPDVRDSYVGLRVRSETLQVGTGESRTVHGLVLVQAERYLTWAYGVRIQASGYLSTPPEDETFSYRDCLARQGTFSLLRSQSTERLQPRQANLLLDRLYKLRHHLHVTVTRLFPEPEASLLSGILLGIESGISPQVRDAFNATGTTHIIAISGFNITIVAGLFLTFFGRLLGSRRGMLSAGAGILVYTILVGADPAVVRAAIMGGLSLAALRLGRRTHGLASLGAAGVAMTAFEPNTVFDVGFQLSFAATLGMILYAEPLQESFQAWLLRRWTLLPARANALADPVGEYFLFTLAAQVTTLPLTIFYFHRLSLASVLTNPAILPAQPAVMVVGGLATLAGSLWIPLGQPLAWVAWPFAAYTIRTVAWFASLPLANLSLGNIGLEWMIGFYGLLFGVTLTGQSAKLPHPRWPSIPAAVALLALSLGVFVTWDNVSRRPDGRLHVVVFDTHGGQATLVTAPSGRSVLINGGRSPIRLEDYLGHRLPPLNRRIDWLVLSSGQEQDVLGLAEITDRFEVAGVVADESAGSGPARTLIRTLHEDGVPFASPGPGLALNLGSGVQLSVLRETDGEAVLKIAMNRAGFLVVSGPQVEGMAHQALVRLLWSC